MQHQQAGHLAGLESTFGARTSTHTTQWAYTYMVDTQQDEAVYRMRAGDWMACTMFIAHGVGDLTAAAAAADIRRAEAAQHLRAGRLGAALAELVAAYSHC